MSTVFSRLSEYELKDVLKMMIAACAISFISGCKSHDSIVFSDDPWETVRVLDASSGRPISNLDIRIHPANTVVCERAPCSPDSTSWRARSDTSGRTAIPRRAIAVGVIAETDAYAPDLLDNATKRESGGWDLELTAKGPSGNDPHPLKLFDGDSKKPLVSTPVTLEFTDPHGVSHTVALVTNALGYVFISNQIAAIGKHSRIRVPYYHLQFVDFADTHHNLYFPRSKYY
jgi:hypothetical protein